MSLVARWLGWLRVPWRIRRLAGASLGTSGERVAEAWLRRRGYRVLERNVVLGDDEIDLVAIDPDGRSLVLVEVKTRSGALPMLPEESVGPVKQRRLARAAARLQQLPRYGDRPVRFDVIAITWPDSGDPELKHIPAAFHSPF